MSSEGSNEDKSAEIGRFLAAADKHIKHSLEHFEKISDRKNLALVNVNMTKILRLKRARLSGGQVYTRQEQVLYEQVKLI